MEAPKISKGGFGSHKEKTRQVLANYSNATVSTDFEEKEVAPEKNSVATSSPDTEKKEPNKVPKKVGRKQGRTKTSISISLDKELFDFLERKQAETRHNKSLLIEDAIRDYYKNELNS